MFVASVGSDGSERCMSKELVGMSGEAGEGAESRKEVELNL